MDWPALNRHEAHVWIIDIDRIKNSNIVLGNMLCHDEVIRARKFLCTTAKERFTYTRLATRGILAKYINALPNEIRFIYGDRGKPYLRQDKGLHSNINFNITHSGDIAILAVVKDSDVGVDVEYLNNNINYYELISRVFSEREIETLRKIAPKEWKQYFFSIWTKKEAYLKAIGVGLSYPLKLIDIFDGKPTSSTVHEIQKKHFSPEMNIRGLHPGAGYVGALAIAGKCDDVSIYKAVDYCAL